MQSILITPTLIQITSGSWRADGFCHRAVRKLLFQSAIHQISAHPQTQDEDNKQTHTIRQKKSERKTDLIRKEIFHSCFIFGIRVCRLEMGCRRKFVNVRVNRVNASLLIIVSSQLPAP